MKKLLLLAPCLFLMLSSFQCGKNTAPDDLHNGGPARSVLPITQQGKWELREVIGSMPVMRLQPGNKNIVKFSGSKYEIYRHDTLEKSGNYALEADATVEQHICLINLKEIFRHRIIFDNERRYNTVYHKGADSTAPPTLNIQEYGKTFIGFSKNYDTLMLASGCFATDGGSISKYVAIQ